MPACLGAPPAPASVVEAPRGLAASAVARRFDDVEVAILLLIRELGIAGVDDRVRAMVVASEVIDRLRRELSALAPGRPA